MSSRNILIALDYTDESMRTVKWAMDQHVRDGDKVTLLHVKPEHPPASHSLPGPGPFAALHEREQEVLKAREDKEQSVERRIHSWAEHSCPPGVRLSWETAQVAPSSVAVSGDGGAARECILHKAGSLKADCLILGSHRASSSSSSAASNETLSYYNVGSPGKMAGLGWRSLSMPTSEYCAQHAACPVIVVPPSPPPASPIFESKSCAAAAVGTASMNSAFLDSLAL